MARTRTQIGTHGKITVVGQVKVEDTKRWVTATKGTRPARYRARTLYRDQDGVTREVTCFESTKAKAEARLKAVVKERQTPTKASGDLRPESTLAQAGEQWLELVKREDSKLSPNTRQQYADSFTRYVEESSITGLTLRELNRVSVLERYLQGIADTNGTGAAKTARSVVSNILGLAVRYDVLPFNAMREVRPAKASASKGKPAKVDPKTGEPKAQRVRDTTRALSRAERQHLLDVAKDHEKAQHADVSDIVWFMAATGVRISEALAVRWEHVDLEAGTVQINGTKTESSMRTLPMPSWLTERLAERAKERGTEGLLFPSPGIHNKDKVRDRRNVARVFREVLDDAGFPEITPHGLRRTVATLIDGAGLPIAVAADMLGHADPAMTARVYLGRKVDLSAAANVL